MRVTALTAALVLTVAAGARAATAIAELIRDPARYANTSVTIEGKVVGPLLSYQADVGYTVQGGDDYRINVVAKGERPVVGSRVRVTGTVGYRPPDEEFSFPPVIVETSRERLP
jgi:hypothetical protein